MDAAARAAVALQKAQATGIYAGLGLWPAEVMAGLVRGQLAEDGTYPGGEGVLSGAAGGAPQAVQDYSPDQPRDPEGRWTNGGGIASSAVPHERSWLELVGKVASALNPVGPAHAEEDDTEEEMRGEGTGGPPPETEELPRSNIRPSLTPRIVGAAKSAGAALVSVGKFNLPKQGPAASVGSRARPLLLLAKRRGLPRLPRLQVRQAGGRPARPFPRASSARARMLKVRQSR